MIPPCDPLILERNSNFQKLHLHLTTNLLNPDASTRAVEELSERKSVADELKALQIRSAKRKLLLQSLRLACTADGIDGRDDDSSNGVRETTAIIAMFLDATSGRNVRDNATLEALLSRDIQHFFERCMRILIPYISDTLSSWTDDLRSLVETTGGNPASTTTISKSKVTTTTTTTQPRSRIKSRLSIAKTPTLPRLSTQIEQRLSRLHQLQTLELPTMRNKAAATAASLIAARGDVIERTIVLLERTKHGSLSRATKARADYLATVAECISAKVQVTNLECLSTIYTPENVAALGNYEAHLRETMEQLKRTQRIANQTLDEYNRVGSTTTAAKKSRSGPPMADIARRYGDLVHEVEVVRKDIQKLKSKSST